MSDEAAPTSLPQLDDDITLVAPPGETADHEAAIDHAVDRLAARFPMVPRDRIVDLVHERHGDYTGAPIRDFIPVLIEHDVRRELAAEVEPLA
ncbi:three-helix bundle dimerization domain-containing protein [Leifsonia sp. McL0607]|uniref:three-helix bundle dimerization domain-containing protein n=1 Tax=Leifsonia sp. McL0607 TaxID=3415672 RepID=UPI003CF43BD6